MWVGECARVPVRAYLLGVALRCLVCRTRRTPRSLRDAPSVNPTSLCEYERNEAAGARACAPIQMKTSDPQNQYEPIYLWRGSRPHFVPPRPVSVGNAETQKPEIHVRPPSGCEGGAAPHLRKKSQLKSDQKRQQ